MIHPLIHPFKKYRVVKTKSQYLPWGIEERYTLLFLLHWWNTPSFAPPHRFERPDDAVRKIAEETGRDTKVLIVNGGAENGKNTEKTHKADISFGSGCLCSCRGHHRTLQREKEEQNTIQNHSK